MKGPQKHLYEIYTDLQKHNYGHEMIFLLPPEFMHELKMAIKSDITFGGFAYDVDRLIKIFGCRCYVTDIDKPTGIVIQKTIDSSYKCDDLDVLNG